MNLRIVDNGSVTLLSDAVTLPGDAVTLLSDAVTLPSDAVTLLSDVVTLPSDAVTLLSDVVNIPDDVFTLTDDVLYCARSGFVHGHEGSSYRKYGMFETRRHEEHGEGCSGGTPGFLRVFPGEISRCSKATEWELRSPEATNLRVLRGSVVIFIRSVYAQNHTAHSIRLKA
jgi:sulfur transfer complex TusBCD TusB component (DsrH family)